MPQYGYAIATRSQLNTTKPIHERVGLRSHVVACVVACANIGGGSRAGWGTASGSRAQNSWVWVSSKGGCFVGYCRPPWSQLSSSTSCQEEVICVPEADDNTAGWDLYQVQRFTGFSSSMLQASRAAQSITICYHGNVRSQTVTAAAIEGSSCKTTLHYLLYAACVLNIPSLATLIS